DVLVDVLALAAKASRDLEAEHVDPQRAQRRLAAPADRDLLDAEHGEGASDGARAHGFAPVLSNSRMTSSTARLAPFCATTRATTPALAATRMFSIFIASITA